MPVPYLPPPPRVVGGSPKGAEKRAPYRKLGHSDFTPSPFSAPFHRSDPTRAA